MRIRIRADATEVSAAAVKPRPSLLAAWRWWLGPALLTLALALIFLDPFAGDWDALDYTVLAVTGRPSSMLLGRMLFIFSNHLLWRAAHALFALPAEQAYLLFKYAVVIESMPTVIACWALARELTGDLRAATIAALLIALSPFFVIYSGQAMTEIPSLLLIAVALAFHFRGLKQRRAWLVLTGAFLLGACVNVREAAALYGPWLVIAPFVSGWRWTRRDIIVSAGACLIFFAAAFAPFGFVYLTNIDDYRIAWAGWAESMRMESALHPVTLANFGPLFKFFFIAAPLVLVAFPFAVRREWKAHGFSPLLVLALVGFAANISLIQHYSIVINGRYLLTGLPGLVPLVAAYLLRAEETRDRRPRTAFITVILGIALVTITLGVAVYPMAQPTIAAHAHTKEYRTRLMALPRDNAVIIAGIETVSITFWRGLGLGNWDVIGTGGGWPGERLNDVIAAHLRAGRRVFLDTDPRWWRTNGWQRSETERVTRLGDEFRFRRITDTIYELRARDDDSARDAPDLKSLLLER